MGGLLYDLIGIIAVQAELKKINKAIDLQIK